jgi:hypothetical protein
MLIPFLFSVSALQLSLAPSLLADAPALADGLGDSGAEPLSRGLKRCADGSVLRTADTCATLPDHRWQFTHEPARQVTSRRWWCRGSGQASEVSVRMELLQPSASTGSPRQISRLDVLLVNGSPASATLRTSVQEAMESFDRLDAFSGRCLSKRSGETVPVLALHGVEADEEKLSAKHIEIPLR